EDGDLFRVERDEVAGEASVVGQQRREETVGVVETGGAACRVDQRGAERGVAGLALGGPEPDGEGDRESGLWVARLRIKVERLRVVVERVAGSQRGERRVAGLASVINRFAEVDRLRGVHPVAGEFADPVPRTVPAQRFEGFCDLAMGAGTPVRT